LVSHLMLLKQNQTLNDKSMKILDHTHKKQNN